MDLFDGLPKPNAIAVPRNKRLLKKDMKVDDTVILIGILYFLLDNFTNSFVVNPACLSIDFSVPFFISG